MRRLGSPLTGAAGTALPNLTSVSLRLAAIEVIIDGGGSVITTGIKADVLVPFGAQIYRWTLLPDQSGSIVVDIWKDTFANFPPTNADTITNSNEPTISSATKADQGHLGIVKGWEVGILTGDILRFNVDSVTTITRCTIALSLFSHELLPVFRSSNQPDIGDLPAPLL